MHTSPDTLEQDIADLGFLSETAMEFLRLDSGEDVYRHVAERLHHMLDEAWVSVSAYCPDRDAVCVRALAGLGGLQERVLDMVGESPVGRYRKVSDEARAQLQTGRLHPIPGGLFAVLFEAVPKPVVAAVERLGGLGDVYGMGCVAQDRIFGAVVIVMRRGHQLKRPVLVESYLHQAAVAMQRHETELALRNSETRFRLVMDQVADLIILLDRDLTILDVNRRGCEALGHTPESLIGTPVDRLLEPGQLHQAPLRWDIVTRGEPFTTRRRLCAGGGVPRLYEVHANPLDDGRLLLIAHDLGGG